MTKIKICGITNYEDARNAVDFGADSLGFNFYNKSPRFIDYNRVNEIVRKLNGKVSIVGVFVNEQIDKIIKAGEICDLDLIQLSGDEDIEYIKKLKNLTNKKIIKTFRRKNKTNPDLINSFNSDYIMLDAFKDGLYGGTGESFDLDNVDGVDNRRLFLAGGLNQNNVNEAIRKIRPFAVDACSGIESKPGKKDIIKMKQFIEAVQ